jgi:hypothetical protein
MNSVIIDSALDRRIGRLYWGELDQLRAGAWVIDQGSGKIDD